MLPSSCFGFTVTMTDKDTTAIMYEQPLSERIRTFLRIDFLFARIGYLDKFDDSWASRATLETINDILDVLGRTDVKQEIIKELKRNTTVIETWSQNPAVDQRRLDEVQHTLHTMINILHSHEASLGSRLRGIELLNTVRQRSNIPAGTCDFDLPVYRYWLRRPVEERSADLKRWVAELDILKKSISMTLQLVRESAIVTKETAQGGFFQRNLGIKSTLCQMIRVAVPVNARLFPEISGGKHRFTVRFMIPGTDESRPVQATSDIPFKLLRCVI